MTRKDRPIALACVIIGFAALGIALTVAICHVILPLPTWLRGMILFTVILGNAGLAAATALRFTLAPRKAWSEEEYCRPDPNKLWYWLDNEDEE